MSTRDEWRAAVLRGMKFQPLPILTRVGCCWDDEILLQYLRSRTTPMKETTPMFDTPIKVGFWPLLPGPPPSDMERKLLPEKCKLMDQDIEEARVILDAALDAAHDPTWKVDHPEEYAAVLAYLNSPERTEGYRGSAHCRVCNNRFNGSQDWYKGPFHYPQGYVHYLTDHGFKPPSVVLQYLRSRKGPGLKALSSLTEADLVGGADEDH